MSTGKLRDGAAAEGDRPVFSGQTVARMWTRPNGYACFVHKRNDQWVVTLEQAGRIMSEAAVEGPGEAIRRAEEFLSSLAHTK